MKTVFKLTAEGINVKSESPIIFLEVGPHDQGIFFRNRLLTRGILGSYYCSPATSYKRTGVRFIVNYDFCLEPEKVKAFVSTVIEVAREFELEKGPHERGKTG